MNEIQDHFRRIITKHYSKEIQRINVVIIFPWCRISGIHGKQLGISFEMLTLQFAKIFPVFLCATIVRYHKHADTDDCYNESIWFS